VKPLEVKLMKMGGQVMMDLMMMRMVLKKIANLSWKRKIPLSM
jgi:hypothetical protein